MALAAPVSVRRFSDGYGRVMVLVSLTVTACVRSSLTSQHYMGLLELLVVVCEAIVCRLGSDYGVQRWLNKTLISISPEYAISEDCETSAAWDQDLD
ncbi:hypothetical protein Bca4012_079255 [Brassica carinata]